MSGPLHEALVDEQTEVGVTAEAKTSAVAKQVKRVGKGRAVYRDLVFSRFEQKRVARAEVVVVHFQV